MPFDASTFRPNPLGLSDEALGIFDELLAWLDKGGDDQCRFDYGNWVDGCGTSACIGGWLELRIYGNALNPLSAIYGRLGLPDVLADQLFFGGAYGLTYEPTPTQAAACVRHLLSAGEVDWPRALAEAAA